jgi:outer membrane protein assembly factor BamB
VSGRQDGIAYHLDPTGVVLGSFPAIIVSTTNLFYGLALAPDGTLYATALNESQLYHYDAAGTLLGTIPIQSSAPAFIRAAGSGSGGISGTPDQISVSAGGSQVLFVDMDDSLAGKSYQVLGSASGTQPGVTYTGVNVPLNYDAYLVFTLLNPNSPLLNGSGGILNSLGQATAIFTLPPASDPSLAGLVVNHAAIVLDVVGGFVVIVEATDAADLLLTP